MDEKDVKELASLGAMLVGKLIEARLQRGLSIVVNALTAGLSAVPEKDQMEGLRQFCEGVGKDIFEEVSDLLSKINPVMRKTQSGEITLEQSRDEIDSILSKRGL